MWQAGAIAPTHQPGQVQRPVDEKIQVPGTTCELFSLVIVLYAVRTAVSRFWQYVEIFFPQPAVAWRSQP